MQLVKQNGDLWVSGIFSWQYFQGGVSRGHWHWILGWDTPFYASLTACKTPGQDLHLRYESSLKTPGRSWEGDEGDDGEGGVGEQVFHFPNRVWLSCSIRFSERWVQMAQKLCQQTHFHQMTGKRGVEGLAHWFPLHTQLTPNWKLTASLHVRYIRARIYDQSLLKMS